MCALIILAIHIHVHAVVVGTVLSKSSDSILISEPVNVTVEVNDEYQSFAMINNSCEGSIHGMMNLLKNNGKMISIENHVQSKDTCSGKYIQVTVFTIVFDDKLLADLLNLVNGDGEDFSNQLQIEVRFQYINHGTESSLSKFFSAYIHVLLNNDIDVSAPTISSNGDTSATGPINAGSKNSTESGVDLSQVCSAYSSMSGTSSLHITYNYHQIVMIIIIILYLIN